MVPGGKHTHMDMNYSAVNRRQPEGVQGPLAPPPPHSGPERRPSALPGTNTYNPWASLPACISQQLAAGEFFRLCGTCTLRLEQSVCESDKRTDSGEWSGHCSIRGFRAAVTLCFTGCPSGSTSQSLMSDLHLPKCTARRAMAFLTGEWRLEATRPGALSSVWHRV